MFKLKGAETNHWVRCSCDKGVTMKTKGTWVGQEMKQDIVTACMEEQGKERSLRGLPGLSGWVGDTGFEWGRRAAGQTWDLFGVIRSRSHTVTVPLALLSRVEAVLQMVSLQQASPVFGPWISHFLRRHTLKYTNRTCAGRCPLWWRQPRRRAWHTGPYRELGDKYLDPVRKAEVKGFGNETEWQFFLYATL